MQAVGQNSIGLQMITTALDGDDGSGLAGYWLNTADAQWLCAKWDSGYSTLSSAEDLGLDYVEVNTIFSAGAVYYKDSTYELTVFAKKNQQEWFQATTVTDSSHTTMLSAGIRVNSTSANTFARTVCPFFIFAGV